MNDQGVAALARGDLETADANFSVALEYNPRFVEPLINLGLVELSRGNYRSARRLLGRARRINPDIAQPHHGLGLLAERRGRPDRASKHYLAALAVDPGFAPARANLARLYFDAGMYEKAREEFRRLSEVAPDDPAGPIGLTESLLKLGRIVEANAIVEQARPRFPSNRQLLILDARRDIREGHYRKAVQALEPLSEKRDEIGVTALGWLATAELARGRAGRAAQLARRALSREPADELAHYVLRRAASAKQH